MSDLEAIQNLLARTARRRRWERAWNGLWHGLFAGALLWLAALGIYKLAPVPISILTGAAALAVLAMAAGFIRGWWRKPTPQQTARFLDQRQNLHERISTALEVASSGPDPGWRALLVSDAARFARKLDPRKIFPYRLPRVCLWAMTALALAACLGFMPEYRTKDYLARQQDAQAIHEVGRKIVEITQHSFEHHPPTLEPARQAMESVEQVGLRLDKANLTRNDALKDLANVAEKLKAQLQDLGKKNPEFKALEHEARDPSAGPNGDSPRQKQMADLEKSLGKAAFNPSALDNLSQQLQNLQQAAAGLSKANSAQAAAEREKLAQNLADLAKQAQELGQPLPNLDDAIAALAANQTDNFQKDMDLATTDLDKVQKMSKMLQQLQKDADRDGKDLPEQLKFGQAELAGKTLEKMIDKLRSGKLTQEEAAQMLDELSRAVTPAAPYGDASHDLHEAAQKLHGGDKPGTAQSLAAAAKELEKIMADMENAKAVEGSLDALNKAELALSAHLKWSQCPSCGDCTGRCVAAGHCLRLGKGSGPGGRGVGTWTDDDSQLYPKMSGLWDNSGVNRPDMDPRGLTGRGDPQLADNLEPTKLHGQITPGGPMPSITLKGVSIKGQSSVSYQEAATAAQSDAQSALNHDQVPRAYQGAVKDYFDDLKK
jgi:polyhydroxyalkanoate synthesis regulator phasin